MAACPPASRIGDPAADGFFFDVAGGAAARARWAVEGSDDNGLSWRPAARCAWVTVRASTDGGRTFAVVGAEGSWLLDCADGGLDLAGVATVAPAILEEGALVRVGLWHGRVSAWLSIGYFVLPLGWFGTLAAAVLRQVTRRSSYSVRPGAKHCVICS